MNIMTFMKVSLFFVFVNLVYAVNNKDINRGVWIYYSLDRAYIFCQIWDSEKLGIIDSFDKVVVGGF